MSLSVKHKYEYVQKIHFPRNLQSFVCTDYKMQSRPKCKLIFSSIEKMAKVKAVDIENKYNVLLLHAVNFKNETHTHGIDLKVND